MSPLHHHESCTCSLAAAAAAWICVIIAAAAAAAAAASRALVPCNGLPILLLITHPHSVTRIITQHKSAKVLSATTMTPRRQIAQCLVLCAHAHIRSLRLAPSHQHLYLPPFSTIPLPPFAQPAILVHQRHVLWLEQRLQRCHRSFGSLAAGFSVFIQQRHGELSPAPVSLLYT